MSQALRKLTAAISKSKSCVVFINQIRMKIGVMFGSPETTTGGNALKFYASVRIDLRRKDVIKQGEQFVGNMIRAKIVKNKVAAPFKEAMFEIHFDEGISKAADIVELGVLHNVIEKSGAWFAFENEKIGQGKENARLFLKANPKILNKIEKEILKRVKETAAA
jgi:recombination protein RecA